VNPSHSKPFRVTSDGSAAAGAEDLAAAARDSAPVIATPPGEPVPAVGPSQAKGYNIRAVALVLDLFLVYASLSLILYGLLAGLTFGLAAVVPNGPAIDLHAPEMDSIVIAGAVVALLYFVLFEWLFGATPGKAVLGLRVVHHDGLPCTFKGALVRGLYRFVDGLFIAFRALASVGLWLPIRFGDRRAGTVVVGRTDPFIQRRHGSRRLAAAMALYPAIAAIPALILLGTEARVMQGGDAYTWRGYWAYARGNHELAAEQFELALENGVSRYPPAEVESMLATTYRRLGRYEDTLAAARLATELDPTYALGWHALGEALRETGDLDSAEASYHKALQLQPDLVVSSLGLGIVLLERGDAEGAISVLETMRGDRTYLRGKADAWLALAYATAGRFDAAGVALTAARRQGYMEWEALQEQIDDLRSGQGGDGVD
jgi:uncharacterized RDD family membrane protein YckC